jgi:hypothetical protein
MNRSLAIINKVKLRFSRASRSPANRVEPKLDNGGIPAQISETSSQIDETAETLATPAGPNAPAQNITPEQINAAIELRKTMELAAAKKKPVNSVDAPQATTPPPEAAQQKSTSNSLIVPRKINAHYRTLGVAPDASADDLKAAQTKAVYDSSLKDDERDKIKNAYAEITAYRKKLAEEEAKRKQAKASQATTPTPKAAQQKAATHNLFKIGPRSLLAVAVIAIGATFGTVKLMQSDEEKNKNAADNASYRAQIGDKIDQARVWAYKNAPRHTRNNLEWLLPDKNKPKKIDKDLSDAANMAFIKLKHDITLHPDKYFGKKDPNKILHSNKLCGVVIEHKDAILSGNRVEYSLGGTTARAVTFQFNKKAQKLEMQTLDEQKKIISSTIISMSEGKTSPKAISTPPN